MPIEDKYTPWGYGDMRRVYIITLIHVLSEGGRGGGTQNLEINKYRIPFVKWIVICKMVIPPFL